MNSERKIIMRRRPNLTNGNQVLIPFDLADDHFFGHVVICLVFQHWHWQKKIMKVLNEILARRTYLCSNQVTFFYRTYIYKIDYLLYFLATLYQSESRTSRSRAMSLSDV